MSSERESRWTARWNGWNSWKITSLLATIAFIPRLYAAIAWTREPVWDGHFYEFGARRIAEGLGYSEDVIVNGSVASFPWCHYPVGYSGFLGLLYWIFGTGRLVGPIANAFLGTAIVGLTHRIALLWLTPIRAVVAAVLCAGSLELILYSPLVMTELLGATLPLLAIWVAVTFSMKRVGSALSGCIIGLSTLVQPQSILLAPIVGGITQTGRVWTRQRLLCIAIATASATVVVLPWTIRNCRSLDGCAFVSTNGGWNLAIGSFPRASGRFETLRDHDGCEVVTGPVQQNSCWRDNGLTWIKQDFRRWIRFVPAKLGYCFDYSAFPVDYMAQADPSVWTASSRSAWKDALTRAFRLLISVSAFAFVGWRARSRRSLAQEAIVCAVIAGLVRLAWCADSGTFWPLAIGIAISGLWPRKSAPKLVPIGFSIAALAAILIVTDVVLSGEDPYHVRCMFWPLAIVIAISGLWPRKSAPELGPIGFSIAALFAIFIVTHIVFFGEDRYHVRLLPLLCILAASVGRSSQCVKQRQHF